MFDISLHLARYIGALHKVMKYLLNLVNKDYMY